MIIIKSIVMHDNVCEDGLDGTIAYICQSEMKFSHFLNTEPEPDGSNNYFQLDFSQRIKEGKSDRRRSIIPIEMSIQDARELAMFILNSIPTNK